MKLRKRTMTETVDKDMIYTVKTGADDYKKDGGTIRRALGRGHLPGEKDPEGNWKFNKSEGNNRFIKPSFPEYIRVSTLMKYCDAPRHLIEIDIYEGILDAKMYSHKQYVKLSDTSNFQSWNEYIASRKKNRNNWEEVVMATGSFIVLNSRGIHARPSLFFCELALDNAKNKITLKHHDAEWTAKDHTSYSELLQMEIQQGEEVEVTVSGKGAKELLDHILEEGARKFEVE